jgi:hypothetical protein
MECTAGWRIIGACLALNNPETDACVLFADL